MININKKYQPYIIIIPAVIVVYGLIYLFSGDFFVAAPNAYNSYSRQALAWLSGRLDLPENVPWLELAVFDGRYFVSFPPFPSLVLLPFVLFFGINTPDNFIAFIISICSLVYAYKLGSKILKNEVYAGFMSLFLILGTNYLHISLWGSVWYIAQNMAFLFTLMAFYYSVSDNKKHAVIALFLFCAAMGCRPFNVLYLPVVLYMIYLREDTAFIAYIKKLLVYSIPAFILGGFYMWLNYARFGNIFEFGHNYLPEFVNDPHGQFYTGRILSNLTRMFFNLNITDFPMFHGFAFWLASPIVITFFVCYGLFIWKFIKGKACQADGSTVQYQRDGSIALPARLSDNKSEKYIIFAVCLLTLTHILLFSTHRTLGGHQFGSRYTVDTLPSFYLGLLFILKNLNPNNKIFLNTTPLLFGLLLNYTGTIQFMSYYY